MRHLNAILILAAAMALSPAANAAERVVTFAVDNMTCASCPYIVKTSMAAVPGVTRVDVSYAKKSATVAFDDAATTAGEIAKASAEMGFPAHLAEKETN